MSGAGELAGRLRALVTLQRRGASRDAIGGAAGDWAAVGDVWAAIEPHGGGDLAVADALDARPRWRVTLRAGGGVRVGDRIAWAGAPLMVRGVLDDPAMPDRTILETEEQR